MINASEFIYARFICVVRKNLWIIYLLLSHQIDRMRKVAFCWLCMMVTFSCDDVLLRDISGKSVILLSPADGISTQSVENVLYWESLTGASKYQVRIYSPTKSSPQLILKDTVITETQMKVTFTKGDYEWCVQALNEAYTSEFACSKLKVN